MSITKSIRSKYIILSTKKREYNIIMEFLCHNYSLIHTGSWARIQSMISLVRFLKALEPSDFGTFLAVSFKNFFTTSLRNLIPCFKIGLIALNQPASFMYLSDTV
jgi:hypothetical protein